MNFTGSNTAGTSTIPRDNLNLRNMSGMRYDQAGPQYNSLLQQGYAGNDIRNALTTQGRPVSDSDYGFLVQNAAMTSPTGRPMAGSDQFFQPVYNSQYQNYNMGNPMSISQYGQQPSYGGGYGGGFMPQMQSPFNPYGNSSGYGNTNSYGGFGGPAVSQQIPQYMIDANKKASALTALQAPTNYGGAENMIEMMKSQQGGMRGGPQVRQPPMGAGPSVMPQLFNSSPRTEDDWKKFSAQARFASGTDMAAEKAKFLAGGQGGGPVSAGLQVQQPPMGGQGGGPVSAGLQVQQPPMGGFMPQMQSPFSYQQPSFQPSYQQPSYQQQSYQPQMQSPFSFQHPQLGNGQPPVSQSISQPEARLAGSGIGSRPVRRAEGGIASLMGDVA
jgi:hypothetical protein